MKKALALLFVVLLLLSCGVCLAQEGENLVRNGDFSAVNAAGMPEDWERASWITDSGVSRFFISDEGYEGNCAAIVNADANDARFTQTIEVEPDSTYRFSCMVRAENCGDTGRGANISINNTYVYSNEVFDTAGAWERVEFYGKTEPGQTSVTLMVRVGGYSGTNTGTAYFDNVEAVKVSSIPEGVQAQSMKEILGSTAQKTESETADENAEPARNTEAYLLMAGVYVIVMLALVRRFYRMDRGRGIAAEKLLIIGLAAAMIVRLVVAVMVRGYYTDLNCFSAWSERIYANGIGNFYAPDYFCDYPPGYMLLLWPVAMLRSLFGMGVQSTDHILLLKMLPMLCDLAGAWLVWKFARKMRVKPQLAAALALVYAFNPAAIIDSAGWAQIDSVFTLLIAICAMQAADEKYISSLLAFAGAMLIKPQAMLFAPLGLFAIVVNLIRRGKAKKVYDFAVGVAAAVMLIYATGFIFCVGKAEGFVDALVRPVTWLVELYSGTLGSYPYITLNALNLYTMLDMNWRAISAAPVWTTIAWVLFALSYAYSMALYVLGKDRKKIFLCGAVLIALIYTFGPKIHERYIFPAMLLLLMAFVAEKDRRLLVSLTAMTVVTAMNEILVLQGGMTPANYGHLQSSEQWLNAILSGVNVLNAIFLAWTAFDICFFKRVQPLKRANEKAIAADLRREKKRDHRLHLKKKDFAAMALATAVYAVIAFTNLGTLLAPETMWVSSQGGEQVVIDLGRTETFRMMYYGGICNTNFDVALSNDGVNWTEDVGAMYKQGEIFRWLYFRPVDADQNVIYQSNVDPGDGSAYMRYTTLDDEYPLQTARYVRLTAKSAGLKLCEVGFRNADNELIEIRDVSRSHALENFATDPLNLVDEQNTVPEERSYFNSTYFDEIYHARTAYEMLHGEYAYEWTHPPLGKVLMMVGIALFGMNPFGWRFMGALVGVLMLPLMYLLVKQLTKNSKLSLIAMLLLALDSMHFTQTRIATIDSYGVFWIMLMYLFMFRYAQMDWNKQKFWKTLIPLGLCGITMGIAWATKWIGIYGSAGLVIIFFWTFIQRYVEYRQSLKTEKPHKFWGKAIRTAIFCVVFFVVIPLLIYYFSYYWHLRYEGVAEFADMFQKRWVQRVVSLQESIFGYHAGLGSDTHYFRSDWYEWPVIWWPMWYYSGASYVPEGMVSSISCMGNPAVWWTGLVALFYVAIAGAFRRRTPKTWLMVLIAFASQFLPWVLVPRSTFIYHYFASVPFIIICTVLMLDSLRKKNREAYRAVTITLIAAAAVLFVAFYPLESGMMVPRSYANYLRWFKWYNF